ncbi:MAG: hypothetical protein E2591_03995 [Achromobacter sp.]|uniref:DUF7946 domain-containing protein n=1 Tax=Achromobacter sp. TaxID=134375 RepID=UPI0012C0E4ED|nr:hypothetical protein [Achromobacter sp.]
MSKRTTVLLRYEGQEAENGELNLYDSADSLKGLALTLGRVVHSFVNGNRLQKKGAHPHNADVFHKGAKKGCFEQIVEIEFQREVIDLMGERKVVWNFWDYLSYAVSTAIGEEYQPTTDYVNELANSQYSPFEEIAETIEEPLKHLHRPIFKKSVSTASFVRGEQEVIVFDENSALYVDTTSVVDQIEHFVGQVTRYNLNTGHGRAFVDQLGKIVPFKIPEFDVNQPAHSAATASMYDKANRLGGERVLVAQRVINAPGTTKRLLVREIRKLGD